jgi:hypothetical protein
VSHKGEGGGGRGRESDEDERFNIYFQAVSLTTLTLGINCILKIIILGILLMY